MGEVTGISWTHHTFSPWFGCTRVSEACRFCYAENDNARYRRNGTGSWGPGAPRVRSKGWDNPRKWNRAAAKAGRQERVFPSLCDPFDRDQPILSAWRADFGQLIRETPSLIWLLLSKRPGDFELGLREMFDGTDAASIPRNVWLGVSVEDQKTANERVPLLLRWPVAVRFLSMEPLLGPVNLTRVGSLDVLKATMPREVARLEDNARPHSISGMQIDVLSEVPTTFYQTPDHMGGFECAPQSRPRVDWVITGGESGAHARPSHPDWFRSVRDQCVAAGVPFHFKQWGEWTDYLHAGARGWEFTHESKGKRYGILAYEDGSKTATRFETRYPWPVGRPSDPGGHPGPCMVRVGKKASGRLLDGVEWNEFPEVTHAR